MESNENNNYWWVLILIGIVWYLLSSQNTTSSSYNTSRFEDYSDEAYEEEPIASDNWECTSDCSGHDAGYEWASDNGISDPDECDGNSDSFIEGCQAWANEQLQEYEDYQEEEEYDNYYY